MGGKALARGVAAIVAATASRYTAARRGPGGRGRIHDPVGFAAVDVAGSIPLILVDPAYQRHGIGTSLLAAALEQVRVGGATGVTPASGAGSYTGPACPWICLARCSSSPPAAGGTAMTPSSW